MRVVTLVLFIFITTILSASDRKQFIHFDKSNDFPFNSVDNVMQDSHGYLWIGSSSGLARYDGYSFEVYNTQDYKNGLPSNRIFCTFETSNGDILVGTNLGLVKYNRNTNKFELLSYSCTPEICEDIYHQIWVATFDGVDVRDVNTLKIKKSLFCETDHNVTIFNGLKSDSKGRVWTITANNGLYVFDSKTYKLQKHIDSKIISNIEHLKSTSLVFDKLGFMWLKTTGNGLFCVDTISFKAQQFLSSNSNKSSIGSNNVTNIYVDTNNDVWVCCLYGYLNKYNRQKNNFERFSPQVENARFIKASSLACINQDKLGNYWIGTVGKGMYCLSEMYNNFQTFISTPNFSDTYLIGQVTSFAELDNGIIALACDGNGIKLYNPTDNRISEFVNNKQLRSKNVHKIITHNGYLWGATWGGGIFKIDLKTNQVTNFTYNVNDSKGLNFNNVEGLYAGDTALIIGTHGDGLAFYNYKKNTFIHKNNTKSTVFDRSINNWINDITKDSRGNVWLSTCYGLCRLVGGKITHYGTTKYNNSINSFDVLSVLEDSRKQLWVLTSGGIDLYDYKHNCFNRLRNKYSLPSNTRSLLEDNDGNMWITTADNLIRIKISNNSEQIFDKNDGIVNGEFRVNSSFKASDGTLYFGSSDGFMKCMPSKIKNDLAIPQLCFRNLYVNYIKQTTETGYLSKMLESTDTLQYSYTDDVISIEVSAILLGRLNKINYAYSFSNDDNKWLNLGKNRIISFTTLKPGTHILKVKATVEYGKSIQKNLIIIVRPKWWMTWWFKSIIILLFISILTWINYLRTQKIKNKNIQLEKLVKERTIELEQKNITLLEQSTKLDIQAQSLQSRNNELLEKQIVIEMKNGELEEALNMKGKLIGIIAHDFKNPLTGIYGLTALLKNDATIMASPKVNKYVDGILNSVTKLKDQMLTVLDWAQGQTQDLLAKPVEINIETIIDDAISLMKESSVQKEITINTQLDYTSNSLIDPRMVSTVMRNLLANAIKFTTRGGDITIVVQEFDTGIEVNVVDTGVGMSADVLTNLFNKEISTTSYGTENEKGSGFGLHICKTFIEKNGGSIDVKSIQGQGTVVSITIPKGHELAIRKNESNISQDDDVKVNQEQHEIEVDKSQTILIIDDDPEILTLLKSTLEQYYTINTATEGQSGLHIARNLVPNLIISDVNMPLVGGMELCKALKDDEMTNHIPIVLITSMKDNRVQQEGYLSGADDLVEKPFDKNTLQYKIQSLLANRKKLSKKGESSKESTTFILPDSYDDVIIKRTLEFINQNFSSSEFDVNIVADKVGLSRTQLWRKFKSATGSNLSDYIQDLRLYKAAEMLTTGKYKISEIAYEVGYSSPPYFAKRFSEKFGVSPSDYSDSKRNSSL